jgi:hypothetical protein
MQAHWSRLQHFVAHLHGGLKESQAAAHALCTTKWEMSRTKMAPICWAPFILVGE